MTAARLMRTIPEAAEVLRVSPNHLYKLCADGEIPHRRLGRRVLIPQVVIDDLCGLPIATTSPSHGPAAVVEGEAVGAGGAVVGEVDGPRRSNNAKESA